MRILDQLRIGQRLGLAFALLIVFAVLIAMLARAGLGRVETEFDLLVDDRLVKVDQLRDIKDNVNQIARSVRNIVIFSDAAQKRAEVDVIQRMRDANAALIEKLDASITSEQGKALLAAAAQARGPYNASIAQVTEVALAGDVAQAGQLLAQQLRPRQLAYMESLDKLIAFQRELMAASADRVEETKSRLAMLLMLGAGLAGVVGAALAWWITKSITGPIGQAVRVAETVAAGDLSSRIEPGHRRDETAQLLEALRRMNDSLARTVAQVRANADCVATASSQIAQGNADLSHRTEEQASNLQQTAASMEQLTSTVRQNADTARQASELAGSASRVAEAGGAVVDQVVSTMEDITHSSRRIADIIGTIDGIAFQTNILALNAAVEAARAGEQGRGFAVVAGEVRNLAQRSAAAAKEIKTLIGASVDQVESGRALVGDAGRTMQDIVAQVKRVSDLISEISAASREQTQGIGQVGDAVAQLDQVTQQNAALVEESAAAADSLKQQAAQLSQTVSAFRLGADAGSPAVSPVAPTAAARPAVAPAAARLAPATPAAASTPRPRAATQPAAPRAAARRATAAPAAAPAAAAEPRPVARTTADDADGDWASF